MVLLTALAVPFAGVMAILLKQAIEHRAWRDGYDSGFEAGACYGKFCATEDADDIDAEAIEKFLRNPGGTL